MRVAVRLIRFLLLQSHCTVWPSRRLRRTPVAPAERNVGDPGWSGNFLSPPGCHPGRPGVTAQITPPPPLNYTRVYSRLYPGMIWNIPWGIVWELPDYTPGYILGALRVYPTNPDYTPSDAGWGIVWEVGVYSGRYYI